MGLPGGREKHALSIVRPATNVVHVRMIGKAFRNAAVHRHRKDIDVAVVLATEGNRLPVRRKIGLALAALGGGKPLGFAAVAGHNPKIAGVAKDDVRLRERGLGEERAGRRKRAGHEEGNDVGAQHAAPL